MRKPASFYFFKRKPIVQEDKYETWRGVANLLRFEAHERFRVEWMVFYYTVERRMPLSLLSALVSQGRP